MRRHGRYAAVFDYRFRMFDTDLGKVHYFGPSSSGIPHHEMEVYCHDPESCRLRPGRLAFRRNTEEMHRSAGVILSRLTPALAPASYGYFRDAQVLTDLPQSTHGYPGGYAALKLRPKSPDG